ncbi:MAG TPA: ABC transporter permease [Candidatus Babeliales bacterium]|nr:ABC transporter permease [Candidatus Babeliales bacterium]
MNQSLAVFWQFLRRDFYTCRPQLINEFINCTIIFPLLYILIFGYLQGSLVFSADSGEKSTILILGSVLLILVILSSRQAIPVLFDMEGNRFIAYQMSVLKPPLVIIEYILFSTLRNFILITPFVPIAKLTLGHLFQTQNASYVQLFILLLLASLLTSAYHFFVVCLVNNSRLIGRIWARYNDPLFMFGGLWAPWYVMNSFSPMLGYITYANPFLYITEGLRYAVLQKSEFFHFSTCVIALLFFSCAFTYGCTRLLKKHLDHI